MLEPIADLGVNFLSNIYLLPVLYLIFVLVRWIVRYNQSMKVINKIPGPPLIPFIGNAHLIGLKREDYLTSLVKMAECVKDKPFYRFWMGNRATIVFSKADHIDAIVTNSKTEGKSWEYEYLYPWLGTGLLTSQGNKWYTRRRLITPSFHFEILNDFMKVMNEQSEILVDVLNDLHRKGEPVDIFKRMGLCTLDIICETAMGQNVNAQMENESDYVKAVGNISCAVIDRLNRPYLWPDFLFKLSKYGEIHDKSLKVLHDFTRKVIKERSDEFEHANLKTQKRVAFLDMLLKARAEDPNSLTFSDIQEEVDTFMFEGHDTTAVATSWAVHMIGSHPEVQKKLHAEIDSVFGSSNRQLKSEDLGELKYLECIIKETLRLFPSVPFFSRRVSEDIEVAGYKLPKGSSCSVFTYLVHRDERFYPDPEKFDPDRFLPENSAERHPYAFIPFSAGKRNCIGQRFALMEEKIILANIFRRFEVKSLKTTEEITPSAELVLRPLHGIPISLKPRVQLEE